MEIMSKKYAILYCVIFCATEIFGLRNLIRMVLQENRNITRVRTVKELQARKDENVVLDFIGLVEKHKGYTAEEYDVQTDDGYILKLHRVTGSPYSPSALGKPVIFLMHGLFISSDFFVVMGPKKDITYLLADAGYDVWLGNCRGNTYSKRQINMSERNSFNFWNFSMDEIGTMDLPKFIDTVLKKTKQKKLTYIGYSMGTSVSYILLSEKPEYNSKINLAVSVTPVAFFNSPFFDSLNDLSRIEPRIKRIAETIKYYEVFPQTKYPPVQSTEIWPLIFFSSLSNKMNFSLVPEVDWYVPAGSALYVVEHYYQMAISRKDYSIYLNKTLQDACNGTENQSGVVDRSIFRKFRKYDFGQARNKLKYGSITPPKYKFSKITCPQAIYYADKDIFVSVKDAVKLSKILKNVVIFEAAPAGYNHLDVFWATDVRKAFLGRILKGIKKFT